jgi:hypothetical protein
VTLRRAILDRPELFVGTMTEKLLTYALGRGVGPEDMPGVRRILRDAAANDYRFSSLVLGIVRSVPFQMRMKPVPDAPTSSSANTRQRPSPAPQGAPGKVEGRDAEAPKNAP